MTRQATCGPAEARERRLYAEHQLALAEVGEPWPTTVERKASGSYAVMAGIAAEDSICAHGSGRATGATVISIRTADKPARSSSASCSSR